MEGSSDLSSGGRIQSRAAQHRIWTKRGARQIAAGEIAHITESEGTSEELSGGEMYENDGELSRMRQEQDSILSGVGNLDKIIGAVSSFWERSGDFSRSGTPSESPSVGYLDRMGNATDYSGAESSASGGLSRFDFSKNFSTGQPAPQVSLGGSPPPVARPVRMITKSDSLVHRPVQEVQPLAALPSITDSPITLLTAASGGSLDLKWLETFDNTTLESIVPRDPHSGRPLTIGSLEHSESRYKQPTSTPTPAAKTDLHSGLDLHALLFPQEAIPGIRSILPPNVPKAAPIKSKRLRPSKRTREMIKQINEQKLFCDIQDDPNGPPLSISQVYQTASTDSTEQKKFQYEERK